MDKHYDIIIVGAGPAGTSAALYAKKMGLKTPKYLHIQLRKRVQKKLRSIL